MNIKVPIWMAKTWSAFVDWSNVVIWSREKWKLRRTSLMMNDDFADGGYSEKWHEKRWEVRRLDVLTAVLFIFCTSWYGYFYGWIGALQGGIMFIMISALALFMRRS